jgi:hydrogenase nickel incorporation protein HypA/HybF
VHEAKLCLHLLDLATSHLARAGGGRILVLTIEVGDLSGVAPGALDRAFPICAAGTPAEGAELRIERALGRELRLRDMEVL